jgi:hypothetical protein
MEFNTIITMIFVIGIVWGGLAFILIRAIKYEKIKSKDGKN